MKSKLVLGLFSCLLCLVIGLVACTKDTLNIQKVSIQLSDLIGNPTDKKTLNELEVILSHVKWSPGTQVSWAKKEDCNIYVTYKNDSKTSEIQYSVWFSRKEAELTSSDPDQSYGELNEKDTTRLKKIVGFKFHEKSTETGLKKQTLMQMSKKEG